MGDTQTPTQTITYTIVGSTEGQGGTFVQIPVEVTPKGLKTFTIDLDECELHISGSKDKNGKLVQFMTFKLPK